ncbi:MAG TPA: hypothetical protein VGJ55_11465 [Pyrinomonadaceae bacterium]
MPATVENLLGLADLTERYAEPEVSNTLLVYHNDRIVLQWHDLPFDPFYVSTTIDESALKSFCDELGCGTSVSYLTAF